MSTLASSTAKFQLAWNGNTQFGAQASAAGVNAVVTLQKLGVNSGLSTWIQPQAGGPIYLANTYNTAHPLVLDVTLPAGNGSSHTSGSGPVLFLNSLVPGSQTQQWQVQGNSPVTIRNTGLSTSLNQNLVIDNAGGNSQAFNAIQVWGANGNNNQNWLQLAV